MARLGAMYGEAGRDGFLGLPSARLGEVRARAAILGAGTATPYGSVGPYCAEGPAAIRAAARDWAATAGHVNFDLGRAGGAGRGGLRRPGPGPARPGRQPRARPRGGGRGRRGGRGAGAARRRRQRADPDAGGGVRGRGWAGAHPPDRRPHRLARRGGGRAVGAVLGDAAGLRDGPRRRDGAGGSARPGLGARVPIWRTRWPGAR